MKSSLTKLDGVYQVIETGKRVVIDSYDLYYSADKEDVILHLSTVTQNRKEFLWYTGSQDTHTIDSEYRPDWSGCDEEFQGLISIYAIPRITT